MIIREHDNAFVMIEQNHHAHLSAVIIDQWKDIFLANDPFQVSVLYAIKHHDCGWRYFDQQPFWNDEHQSPYSFIDFPVIPKTVLYTQGVDDVEAHDPYAAALCSAHYARFISSHKQNDVQLYINREEKRRRRILSDFSHHQLGAFDKHLALLQFADNLSLYICLNEPGVNKENEHDFFKKEIPFPKFKQEGLADSVKADWKDDQTVFLQGLPHIDSFSVKLEKKNVSKQAIKETGLLPSYKGALYTKEDIHIQIESVNSFRNI